MKGICVSRRQPAAIGWLAALALVPAGAEAQRVEGTFQRTVSVSGQTEIDVVTGSGRIDVRPGPAGRVEIHARIQASEGWGRRSALSPEERVRRIEASPPIEQAGNVVRIGRIVEDELREGVSISYTLTVPPGSSLRAKTGSGSQHLEGVGDADATSGSGSLTAKDLGGSLRASTGSGSISADGIGGDFRATAGSGSIRATGVAGSITAKTGSGAIDVAQTGKGEVDVSSGSGAVRLRGVSGGVRASTASGGLTVQGELSGDWDLSASSGRISIDLPAGQGFDLDATTGSGRIDVGIPVTVTGTVGRRSLRGSARGGGPLLRVRTSSGSIRIQ